ncbi:MAG: PEGA domain-containing protein, partial [Polyangiaceae bacterium]
PELPTSSGPDPEALAEAKRLFLEGNALRKAGDCQRAVVKYRASRERVKSVANTQNAAVCLRDLGRADEALEMYEELLTAFSDDLSAEERQVVSRESNELRAEVGAIDVIANVDGTVVVDGRSRGALPLALPIRVMPGNHKVVVLAQGYSGFEKSVSVKARQTVAVDATLEPLADAGQVSITDPTLEGAQVFVDGAPLGIVPWEGNLEPGTHRFFLRRGDEGSAPKTLDVVKGQTVVATATLAPLGADLRIEVTPSTAELRIDGVAVGAGRWQGRLPLGSYEVIAEEEGYLTSKSPLKVDERTDRLALELEVDEEHPRWQVPIPGGPWVEVLGGGLIAPSFGGQAESNCDFGICRDTVVGNGWVVMGRAGYEFPMGLSVMAGGGYMRAGRSFLVEYDNDFSENYDMTHEGPFGLVGLRQRFVFADIFETRLSYSVGVMGTSANAEIDGDDPTFGEFSDDEGGGGVNVFLMPEIQLGMRFSGFGIALGFATPLFLLGDQDAGDDDGDGF